VRQLRLGRFKKPRKKSILPFVIGSIFFHLLILALLLIYQYEVINKQALKEKKQPEYIEITELPVPKEKETKPPQETKRLAERSHTAEKETTRDEFTKRSVAVPPPPKPAVQQKPRQEVKKQEPAKTAKKAESKPKTVEKPKQETAKQNITREDLLRDKTLASLPKEQMKEETGGQTVGRKYEEREVPNITREQLFSNVPSSFPQGSQGTQDYLGARDVNMKEDTVELSTTEFRYLSYFAKLKSQIESVWNYPQESRFRGEEGQLFLVFTIKRNGELENIELISSSGYARLDNEAIRAIRSAAPYSPFPEGWGSLERLHIRATFIYQFGGFIR